MARQIRVVEGDLLAQDVDVIVNAANTHLEHMGGIAGIISRAGGPKVQKESRALRPVPTGGAVATTAGDLPFKAVIHAVGPIYGGGDFQEAKLLASAHRQSMRVAAKLGVRSIAFPAISCGIFGYPVEEAAQIAVTAVDGLLGHLHHLEEVRFCLVHPEHLAAYRKALRRGEN